MKVKFIAAAEKELIDAVAYYNSQSEGLGFEFAAEIQNTISRIIQYPNAWTKLSRRTRRCRANRFPYGVIYQLRGKTILIVAVMHLQRDPDKWKSRIKSR